YRDYVISAFNRDVPFDRFVTEQLAGDEIDPGNRELLVAAGFHRLGPVRRNAGNPKLVFSRNEALTEMTDAVGVVFLGMTVGCARCHDHKFDEVSLTDYYRLQAFLSATQEHDFTADGQAISTVRHVEAQRTPIHVLRRGNEEFKGRQVGPGLPPAL